MPLIIRFPRPSPRLRMFCIPHAGAGASIFRTWPAGLDQDIEVCAVQLPGREQLIRKEPFRDLPSAVDAIYQEVRSLLDVPFAFFGHSMGAILAFEVIRKVRQVSGQMPMYLFASAHAAPQQSWEDAPIHGLPDQQFIAEISKLNGTPPEVWKNAELSELLLPVLRADMTICETYEYIAGEPLTCPISVFGGTEDDEVSLDELEAWREQSISGFTRRMLRGNHFFVNTARRELLSYILADLKQVAGCQATIRT